MSMRKSYWLASLALPILAIGCGGGGKEEAPAFEEKAATTAPAATGTAAAPAGTAAAPAGGAAIAGKINFTGTAPAMENLKMDADNYCKMNHPTPVKSQEVTVNNGTLEWVLVYVKSGLPAGG